MRYWENPNLKEVEKQNPNILLFFSISLSWQTSLFLIFKSTRIRKPYNLLSLHGIILCSSINFNFLRNFFKKWPYFLAALQYSTDMVVNSCFFSLLYKIESCAALVLFSSQVGTNHKLWHLNPPRSKPSALIFSSSYVETIDFDIFIFLGQNYWF